MKVSRTTELLSSMMSARKALDSQSPCGPVLIMDPEIMALYDSVRPWASIQEHMTNTKYCSDGKKRGGIRYYLSHRMYK